MNMRRPRSALHSGTFRKRTARIHAVKFHHGNQQAGNGDDNDDTNEESIPASHSEAATVLIPLLERDEATMQKAQAQINQWEAEDATDEKLRVE